MSDYYCHYCQAEVDDDDLWVRGHTRDDCPAIRGRKRMPLREEPPNAYTVNLDAVWAAVYANQIDRHHTPMRASNEAQRQVAILLHDFPRPPKR